MTIGHRLSRVERQLSLTPDAAREAAELREVVAVVLGALESFPAARQAASAALRALGPRAVDRRAVTGALVESLAPHLEARIHAAAALRERARARGM